MMVCRRWSYGFNIGYDDGNDGSVCMTRCHVTGVSGYQLTGVWVRLRVAGINDGMCVDDDGMTLMSTTTGRTGYIGIMVLWVLYVMGARVNGDDAMQRCGYDKSTGLGYGLWVWVMGWWVWVGVDVLLVTVYVCQRQWV